MTDQTVPVPVELLKTFFENTVLTRDAFAGEVVDVRPSGIEALIGIRNLIPTPPKVGDTLTADEVRQLPSYAFVVDADGDMWVRAGVETVYRVNRLAVEAHLPLPEYEPYTLVHLPADRD